jgi:hypothetical protein
MLAVKSFPKSYVEAVRRRFDDQLAAYAALGVSDETFERGYAAVLVLALESCFVHRMRGQEGKGANPLARVRDLAAGIAAGEPVELTLADFEQLSADYLTAIEQRFPDA